MYPYSMKKETISFIWKLLTALIAALGTALGVSAAQNSGILF